MKHLTAFFFTNDSRRWFLYLSSAVASLFYGLVSVWGLGRPEDKVLTDLILVFPSALLLTVLVLVIGNWKWLEIASMSHRMLPRLSYKLMIAGAISIFALANLTRIDLPSLQASLANFALERLTRQLEPVHAATLSPEQLVSRFQRASRIVAASSSNRVPVDRDTVKKAEEVISGGLEGRSLPAHVAQAGWAAAADLQSLTLNRDIQLGLIIPRELPNTAYVLNSFLELKDNLYFLGDHSTMVVNSGIGIEGAAVVFDKIDFKGSGYRIVLEDEKASARVSDSKFLGGAQVLDGITWVDVRFQGSKIVYLGGALRLRNVSFTDCEFEIRSPKAQELMELIYKAGSQPITYFLEPIASQRRFDSR